MGGEKVSVLMERDMNVKWNFWGRNWGKGCRVNYIYHDCDKTKIKGEKGVGTRGDIDSIVNMEIIALLCPSWWGRGCQ